MRYRSNKEKEFHELLKELFPNAVIKHDYKLGTRLQLDFLITTPCKIGFEVDGAQHYSFNSMFHRTADDFKAQKERDARKEQICEAKGIALIRVDATKPFNKKEVKEAVYSVLEDMPVSQEPKKVSKKASEWEEKAKERQREFRKEQYRKMKERRKR